MGVLDKIEKALANQSQGQTRFSDDGGGYFPLESGFIDPRIWTICDEQVRMDADDRGLLLTTNGKADNYQVSTSISIPSVGLPHACLLLLEFDGGNSLRVGIATIDESAFLTSTEVSGDGLVEGVVFFTIPRQCPGGARLILMNNHTPIQRVRILDIMLCCIPTVGEPSAHASNIRRLFLQRRMLHPVKERMRKLLEDSGDQFKLFATSLVGGEAAHLRGEVDKLRAETIALQADAKQHYEEFTRSLVGGEAAQLRGGIDKLRAETIALQADAKQHYEVFTRSLVGGEAAQLRAEIDKLRAETIALQSDTKKHHEDVTRSLVGGEAAQLRAAQDASAALVRDVHTTLHNVAARQRRWMLRIFIMAGASLLIGIFLLIFWLTWR